MTTQNTEIAPPPIEDPSLADRVRRTMAAAMLAGSGLIGVHSADVDRPSVTPTEVTTDNPACPPETATYIAKTPEKWARLFSEDPAAGALQDPTDPQAIAHRIKVDSQGRKIKEINLTGSASDDDDSVDAQGQRTGGLGKPDDVHKNTDLAQKRAETLEPQLESALSAEGITDLPPIGYETPIEAVLDPPEIAIIDGFAKQFGYPSTVSMIEQYNRTPEKAPPDVLDYLDKVLKSQRNVRVTVTYGSDGPKLSCVPVKTPPKQTPPAQTPHHEPGPFFVPIIDWIPRGTKPTDIPPESVPKSIPVIQPPLKPVRIAPKPQPGPIPPQPSVVELRKSLRSQDKLLKVSAHGQADYPAQRRKQPTKENRSYLNSAHASHRKGGHSVHQNRRGKSRG